MINLRKFLTNGSVKFVSQTVSLDIIHLHHGTSQILINTMMMILMMLRKKFPKYLKVVKPIKLRNLITLLPKINLEPANYQCLKCYQQCFLILMAT